MKFTIEKDELYQLASTAQKAAAAKDTVPILSGLLIEATEDGTLVMTATDLEHGIRTSSSRVDVMRPGKVLVNARYFSDLVRYLPPTDIIVEYLEAKAKLNISYGKSKSQLNTYSALDFPELSLEKLEEYISLPQQSLKNALKKTSFAAATTHFRQVFTGTLFDVTETNVNIVASDTHRLAFKSLELTEPVSNPRQFTVPNRTIGELLRILADVDDEVRIGFIDNNVVFTIGDTYFTSRLIEGQYPNYNQVIPQTFTTELKVKPSVLIDTLERALIIPTDDKTIKRVQLHIGSEEILVTSYSEKMGEINEIIEDFTLTGTSDLTISFNTKYILDIAKIMQLETEEISIHFTGALSPSLLTIPNDDSYKYVLVPLRTI